MYVHVHVLYHMICTCTMSCNTHAGICKCIRFLYTQCVVAKLDADGHRDVVEKLVHTHTHTHTILTVNNYISTRIYK